MHQSRGGPESYLHVQLQGDIYTECKVVSALALGSWRPLAWGWSPRHNSLSVTGKSAKKGPDYGKEWKKPNNHKRR